MKSDAVHIGVDVSKAKLDVYNPIDGSVIEIDNDASGFRTIRGTRGSDPIEYVRLNMMLTHNEHYDILWGS